MTRGNKDEKKYGTVALEEADLEVWPNSARDRDYEVNISYPEFTCLCPRSGYPDFATIRVVYVPGEFIVELKSIKLYLNRYRDVGIGHEEVTNRIFDDLKRALKPRKMEVTGDFNVRGNVKTVVTVKL